MQSGASRRDRILVIATDPGKFTQRFPQFEHPVTLYSSADVQDKHERPELAFDVVLLDVATGDLKASVHAALRLTRPDGSLVVIDRALPGKATLGRVMWALGVTGRRTHLGSAAKLLASHGLVRAAGFVLHPSVERLRAVVGPGFTTPRPRVSHALWKHWFLDKGGFYLQPPSVVAAAWSASRQTVAENALQALKRGESRPLKELQVLDCRLSGTNVLILRVADGALGGVFLRVPMDEMARRRVAHHYATLTHLLTIGFDRAPRPLGAGQASGFDFFAEAAMVGTPLSSFASMRTTLSRLPGVFDVLADLHLLEGRAVPVDKQVFAEHVEPRLECLRHCLIARGRDDGGCAIVADLVRQGLEGQVVRLGLCHGDTWLPNFLFDSGRVSGVVDWDMSDLTGLTLFDVAGLVTTTLAKGTGGTIEQFLQAVPDHWSTMVPFLTRYAKRTGTTAAELRTLVLCHWLDLVARHYSFDRLTDEWFRRRVEPVLQWAMRRKQ